MMYNLTDRSNNLLYRLVLFINLYVISTLIFMSAIYIEIIWLLLLVLNFTLLYCTLRKGLKLDFDIFIANLILIAVYVNYYNQYMFYISIVCCILTSLIVLRYNNKNYKYLVTINLFCMVIYIISCVLH